MKKIIIIDDDEEMCAELGEILRAEGFEVDTVFDGASGCSRVAEKSYDVVILDLKLPKLTGYQVLETIRQSGRQVKIIVSSGRPMSSPLLTQEQKEKDQEEKILSQADAVLSKPFMVDIFVATVRKLAGLE